MSHEIDTAAYSLTPAWHGLGVTVPHGMFLDEAFERAGLDWSVGLRPALVEVHDEAKPGYVPVPGQHVVIREDRQAPLGIVGSSYTPFQNHDLREMIRGLMEADPSAWVESAMSLDGGRDIVLQIRLREWSIGDSDPTVSYLTAWNNHTGRSALQAFGTDIRVVCRNTLQAADGGAKGRAAIRHTRSVHDEAAQLVRAAQEAREASLSWEDTARRFAGWQMAGQWNEGADALTRIVVGSPPPENEGAEARKKWNQRFIRTRNEIVGSGSGFGSLDRRNSAWDLLNRFTGWVDHLSTVRASKGGTSADARMRSRASAESVGARRKRDAVAIIGGML